MTRRRREEFQALFVQEAEMRLSRLGALLLDLERVGAEEGVVEEICREVHTLKGAAAVVGFDEVSQAAHAIEDQIQSARDGEGLAAPATVDALLKSVDALSALTTRASGGAENADTEPAAADVSEPAPKPAPVAAAPPRPPHAPAIAPPVAAAAPVTTHSAAPATAIMVPVERLDQLVRLVGESAASHLRVGRVLTEQLGREPTAIAEFAELSRLLNELQEHAMRARMVPVATITDQLHRTVRDVARALGKDVKFDVSGGETELDRSVLHQLADTLLHLVRNSVDHGIETAEDRVAAGKPPEATVRLHAMQLGAEVIIAVSDDGRGIDVDGVRRMAAKQGVDASAMSDEDALQLIFRSGLSTSTFVTDISGRGVGLDVVRASVAAASGRVQVRSERGVGTEFRVIVPVSLAVVPCLVVSADGQRFALPLRQVISVLEDVQSLETHAEGRPMIWSDRQPVPVSGLAEVLGLDGTTMAGCPIVVVSGAAHRHAFKVDALVGKQDVMVKDLGKLLPGIDVVSGASVGVDGSILLLLDPTGIIDRARESGGRGSLRGSVDDRGDVAVGTDERQRPHRRILVVDDALTIRELQRSILERAGYDVRVANDGTEALARLAEEPSDLVLTDVDMPKMDGFTLTAAIRSSPTLTNIPILILTSRATDDDRQRGLEAGANGYIVKSAFDEAALLSAVERLLGSYV